MPIGHGLRQKCPRCHEAHEPAKLCVDPVQGRHGQRRASQVRVSKDPPDPRQPLCAICADGLPSGHYTHDERWYVWQEVL